MNLFRTLLRPLVVGCALVLLAGCSTVSSRIERNRAEFDSWPLEIREKIAAGQIDIGFTPRQVAVAVGEPDRVFTRRSADGTTEVWSYRDRRPRLGLGVGVGMGSWGHRGGSFGTVGLGTGIGPGTGYHDDEKLGVIFDASGRVSAIETRER